MSAFSHNQAAAAAAATAAALQTGLPTSTSTAPSSCLTSPSDRCLGPTRTLQVGMGLNLNIRRVIFHAVTKREGEPSRGDTILHLIPYCTSVWMCKNTLYDVGSLGYARSPYLLPVPTHHANAFSAAGPKANVPVSVSMLKQIAGRAGRRSSQWPEGLATCRDPADVARLQEALAVR